MIGLLSSVPWVGGVDRVRLQVLLRTDGERLCPHVHGCTEFHATVYTDEWKGYNQVERDRLAVGHGEGEWARDEDGDGISEVHVCATRASGRDCATFCVPSEGSTRST